MPTNAANTLHLSLRTLLGCACLTLAASALAQVSSAAPENTTDSKLQIRDCHLRGLSDKVECFSLERLENPAEPQGKRITLHAARVPALVAGDNAPLVFLAGGPGQSAIEIGGQVTQVLRPLLSERDLIFLEQRGTGSSNGFKCAEDNEDPYTSLMNETEIAELTQQCVQSFDGDLSQYNTPNAIDDFAAMIDAMGYSKVHLYGGSYGTRAALVFMRRHPQLVSSATLDSMAPVQAVVGPFARHGYRALDLLFSECEQTTQCHASFPQLRATFWQLWQSVGTAPMSVAIRHPHSFAATTLKLDQNKLFHLVINNLYSQQQRQLLPYAIDQAGAGNFSALAGLIASSSGDNGIYNGLMANIVCNEDIRRATPAQLQADTLTPFGNVSLNMWQQLCANWPSYSLAADYFQPVDSDIPVLALSGKLDPVTPPAWGEETVASLSNATHLVADEAAHIVALRGCGPKLLQQFINNPSASPGDSSCLKQLPPVHFMRDNNSH